jgi:hypothetical protein
MTATWKLQKQHPRDRAKTDGVDGVAFLHSLGIVHCDLTRRNILEADHLVIYDLQCLHATGHCRPYEIDDGDYTRFSFASDVFALGALVGVLLLQ